MQFDHQPAVLLPVEQITESQRYIQEYEEWIRAHPKEVKAGKIPKAMRDRYTEECARLRAPLESQPDPSRN